MCLIHLKKMKKKSLIWTLFLQQLINITTLVIKPLFTCFVSVTQLSCATQQLELPNMNASLSMQPTKPP